MLLVWSVWLSLPPQGIIGFPPFRSIHSFSIHISVNYLSINPSIHSLIHPSFLPSLMRPIQPSTHSLIHPSFLLSLTRPIQPSTLSLIHPSFLPSLTRPIQPSTHSLIHPSFTWPIQPSTHFYACSSVRLSILFKVCPGNHWSAYPSHCSIVSFSCLPDNLLSYIGNSFFCPTLSVLNGLLFLSLGSFLFLIFCCCIVESYAQTSKLSSCKEWSRMAWMQKKRVPGVANHSGGSSTRENYAQDVSIACVTHAGRFLEERKSTTSGCANYVAGKCE